MKKEEEWKQTLKKSLKSHDFEEIEWKSNVFLQSGLPIDTKIYRYIKFDHFIEMLTSEKLYVANRHSFLDKREFGWKSNMHFFFPALLAGNSKVAKEHRKTYHINNEYSKKVCVSCWSMEQYEDRDESYTMWKTRGESVIRIESSVSDLIQTIDYGNTSIFIAPVIYEAEKSDAIAFDMIFKKIKEYSDENELRLCAISEDKNLLFPIVDMSKLIHKVVMSPFVARASNNLLIHAIEERFPIMKGKFELSHIAEY